MLVLYRWLTELLALILWFPGRFWAGRGETAWADRLQLRRLAPADVWLHGASVGEVRLLSYLVRALSVRAPELRIHMSVMSKNGFATVRDLAPEASVSFLPLDVPRLTDRAFDQVSPRLLVCAEVEIWPALLGSAARRGIPVILVNARLKERSFRRLARFPRAIRSLLAQYERLFFRSSEDRERYLGLGLDPTAGELTGDMKFDAPVEMQKPEARLALRAKLGCGPEESLLVCGSTRPDEEEQLAARLKGLVERKPHLRVVVAPRHVERSDDVARLFESAGFRCVRYSQFSDPSPPPVGSPDSIVLVDVLGVLNDIYSAGDIAFVGGTLTNTGGHNILEPVWRGRPVLFGPDTANVKEAAEYVVAHRYGQQVSDARGLEEALEDWLSGRTHFVAKTLAVDPASSTSRIADYILSRIDWGARR